MNPIKVLAGFRALNPAQKQILREKQLELTMPPDAWIRFLQEVSDFDRHGDSTRKFFGWTAILLMVALLVCAFIVSAEGLQQVDPGLLFGTLFLGLIVCTIIWAVLRGQDLHNNMRSFVLPLFTVLREEMDPKDKLTLEADFRGAECNDKLDDERSYSPNSWSKVKESTYVDPWLVGKARLADGSTLEWQIEDRLRKRRIRKRSSSGKTKFKTKYKVKRRLSLRLGLQNKRYHVADTTAKTAPDDRMEVRRGETRTTFQMKRTVVTDEPGSVLAIHEFLDPLTDAYNRAQPVKKGSTL